MRLSVSFSVQIIFFSVFALLASTATVQAQYAPSTPHLVQYVKGSITIDGASGKHVFSIEIARNEDQRAQGLMFRRDLPADAGMLFLFDDEATRSFWMKNTLIPLDMLFVAADGHIVDIHERAVPLDETPIPSDAPALAVVELNGGTIARLGIKIGDIVHGPGLAGQAL